MIYTSILPALDKTVAVLEKSDVFLGLQGCAKLHPLIHRSATHHPLVHQEIH